MKFRVGIAIAIAASSAPATVFAANVCTLVADAQSGEVLIEEGDCRTRVTPASTFKIPLAIIGYDSGFLTDTATPSLPFKKRYADWGGKEWTQATTPLRWMKHSVVWYSQEITRALGVPKLAAYTQKFNYGNSGWSGDPGKNNALDRAWISSSLKISPREQVAFLQRLVSRTLPVSAHAMQQADAVVERWNAAGSTVAGKTGSAYPRNKDGSFNRARGWGWFVGWAERDGQTYVFARLDQDTERHAQSGGLRARQAFLDTWPKLAAQLPR